MLPATPLDSTGRQEQCWGDTESGVLSRPEIEAQQMTFFIFFAGTADHEINPKNFHQNS